MRITKRNQEKNKKENLKKILRKIKKEAQGITLIALVVTIIVLLILAGIAINLTVGDNGLFKRAQNAADTWQMAEQNEQSEMEQARDFLDDYFNNITRVDGVPIPNGFYYAGGSKDTGLVISDNSNDEKEWNKVMSTGYVPNDLAGNQFVWVPVENPNEFFKTSEEKIKLNGVETTTNIYSNLTIKSEDSYIGGMPGETSKNDISVVREPDVLTSFDTDTQYYNKILKFDSTKNMADSMVEEYKAMSDSIKKYKGFYIGRYELTGTVEAPTEKAGKVLTADSSEAVNWYNLYKACKNVVVGKENVKSTMIYGVQWDMVCSWLKKSGFDTDSNSSSWGNYYDSSGNADIEGVETQQKTGYSEYWKANNVYDLAGNYYEWTQEAGATNNRVGRGGSYNSGAGCPASDRNISHPDYSNSDNSTRATLYML